MVDRDTVDYRDTSSFDDSSLQDVQTIKSAILHKQYGKDVRSALAQLPDSLIKLFEDTGGNSNAEVEEARGGFETLGLHEQAQNADIDKVTVEVQNARTNSSNQTYQTLKERIDNQENDLNSNFNDKLSQISAIPETFANLAALQSKYPTGKTGIFVTADNGHKYIWSNNSWLDAGVYQAVGIADGQIDEKKIAKINNITSSLERLENRYVSTSATDIAFTTSPNYFVTKIPISSNRGQIIIPLISVGSKFIAATTENGQSLVFENMYDELNDGKTFSRTGYKIDNNQLIVDLEYVSRQMPEKYIYISQAYATQQSFYVKTYKDTATEDVLELSDSSNVVNKTFGQLSSEFSPVNIAPLYRRKNISWNTTTGDINYLESNQHAAFEISNLPTVGQMRFKVSSLTEDQFIIFLDAQNKAIANFSHEYNTGEKSNSYIYVDNGDVVFDFENAKKAYANLAKLQITQYQYDILNFNPTFIGTTKISDVMKWIDNTTNNDELVLPSVYPVLKSKTANVVLDNVLKSGSVYDGQTVLATKQLGTQKIGLVDTTDSSIGVKYSGAEDYVTLPIKRVDSTADAGKKTVMLIGESTTESTTLLNEVKSRLDSDATDFEMVGTRIKGDVHYEARSGWGAGALHYVQTANGMTNSFYNPDKQSFDWKWYLEKNSMASPDIVVINFGLNDVNRYVTNGTTLSQTEHYNFFISQIRAVKPDTIIVIGLTHIYSSFGNFRHNDRRTSIANQLHQTISDFDNRTNDNIYIAPYFLNIDSLWDMQYEQIPLNDYQPTEKVDYRGVDAIHPSDIGYKKMADVMYASIKQTL